LKKIKILDTTLRDGSYPVNFSFTSKQTSLICNKLEQSGIEFIEIGHGTGLNSSNRGYGKAAQTDEEYMIAAQEVLKDSKYGMFCIPGIAHTDNLDVAAEHNMSFVRIGTDVTKVTQSKDFIKKAKDLGLYVFANYMKSYAMNPEKFAQQVLLSEKYGADIVYIVDSAGGMFPENIKEYFNSIRKVSEIPIGFHAHDNLGFAIANSISAVDMGMEIVDSSLQGLGRSSGNASTELLVLALKKKGYETGINFLKVLEIGWNYIQPLLKTPGKNPLDTISGYADFHSSYMSKILNYAIQYNIDPLNLILEITKIDKINAEDRSIIEVAKKIPKSTVDIKTKYDPSLYFGGEQDEKS